jgi:hypothetical protein
MFGWLGVSATAEAENVPLQQPTATFSQATAFGPSRAINDNPSDGWAICHCNLADPVYGNILAETAVFETVTDLGFEPSTSLTFTFDSNWGPDDDGPFLIGRFRLSVTTDDRSEFADGLDGRYNGITMEQIPGDVTANWTVLNPTGASATEGVTLTELSDNSILASDFEDLPAGPPYFWSTYTVTAQTALQNITGFRLEVMEDPSLPAGGDGGGGPGTHSEGNFVLTNFTIDAVEGPPLVGLDGDYNDNGVVDAADYVQWRKSLTTQDPLANDPLGLPIDQDQYDQWRENFGNPLGSGAALGSTSIPEPATWILAAFAAIRVFWTKRRR